MKKLFIAIAAAAIVLSSCGGGAQKAEDKASVEDFSDIAKTVSDKHNAQNSLDYKGTYTGKVPTASGEGMIVSIILSDSTYTKNVEYVNKKDSKSEEKGKYTWNADGTIITLEGVKDTPNKYFVGENTLTQLDMDGNRITGELAEQYVLKK